MATRPLSTRRGLRVLLLGLRGEGGGGAAVALGRGLPARHVGGLTLGPHGGAAADDGTGAGTADGVGRLVLERSADRPRRPVTERSGMAVVAGAGRTSRLPAGSPSAALPDGPPRPSGGGRPVAVGVRRRGRRERSGAARWATGRGRGDRPRRRPAARGARGPDRGEGVAARGCRAGLGGRHGAERRGGRQRTGRRRGARRGRRHARRRERAGAADGSAGPGGRPRGDGRRRPRAGDRPSRGTAGGVDPGGEQAVAPPVGAVPTGLGRMVAQLRLGSAPERVGNVGSATARDHRGVPLVASVTA